MDALYWVVLLLYVAIGYVVSIMMFYYEKIEYREIDKYTVFWVPLFIKKVYPRIRYYLFEKPAVYIAKHKNNKKYNINKKVK